MRVPPDQSFASAAQARERLVGVAAASAIAG